jgi:hypothetical protein
LADELSPLVEQPAMTQKVSPPLMPKKVVLVKATGSWE